MNAFHHRCIARHPRGRRAAHHRRQWRQACDRPARPSTTPPLPIRRSWRRSTITIIHRAVPRDHGVPLRASTGRPYDENYLEKTGLAGRSARERIARPEFLDEFGTWYGGPTANAHRKIVGAVIQWCEAHGVHWNLWHWKDVRGMGLMHMKEGTPWPACSKRSAPARCRRKRTPRSMRT